MKYTLKQALKDLVETLPKYIEFKFLRLSASGKTSIWEVRTKDRNVKLGEIRWNAPWRRYSFFVDLATMQELVKKNSELVFEERCLRDIANCCVVQTKIQKPTAAWSRLRYRRHTSEATLGNTFWRRRNHKRNSHEEARVELQQQQQQHQSLRLNQRQTPPLPALPTLHTSSQPRLPEEPCGRLHDKLLLRA